MNLNVFFENAAAAVTKEDRNSFKSPHRANNHTSNIRTMVAMEEWGLRHSPAVVVVPALTKTIKKEDDDGAAEEYSYSRGTPPRGHDRSREEEEESVTSASSFGSRAGEHTNVNDGETSKSTSYLLAAKYAKLFAEFYQKDALPAEPNTEPSSRRFSNDRPTSSLAISSHQEQRSQETDQTQPQSSSRKRKILPRTFAQKLTVLLNEEGGDSAIIHWMPEGDSFRIADHNKFLKEVLPKYFNNNPKFESFTRRLKRWGFRRISKAGTKANPQSTYACDLFHRDKPNLCALMCVRSDMGVLIGPNGKNNGYLPPTIAGDTGSPSIDNFTGSSILVEYNALRERMDRRAIAGGEAHLPLFSAHTNAAVGRMRHVLASRNPNEDAPFHRQSNIIAASLVKNAVCNPTPAITRIPAVYTVPSQFGGTSHPLPPNTMMNERCVIGKNEALYAPGTAIPLQPLTLQWLLLASRNESRHPPSATASLFSWDHLNRKRLEAKWQLLDINEQISACDETMQLLLEAKNRKTRRMHFGGGG